MNVKTARDIVVKVDGVRITDEPPDEVVVLTPEDEAGVRENARLIGAMAAQRLWYGDEPPPLTASAPEPGPYRNRAQRRAEEQSMRRLGKRIAKRFGAP